MVRKTKSRKLTPFMEEFSIHPTNIAYYLWPIAILFKSTAKPNTIRNRLSHQDSPFGQFLNAIDPE